MPSVSSDDTTKELGEGNGGMILCYMNTVDLRYVAVLAVSLPTPRGVVVDIGRRLPHFRRQTALTSQDTLPSLRPNYGTITSIASA